MLIETLEDLSRRSLERGNRPFRRYLLDRMPLDNQCTIITGPRGVGKTTAMLQVLGDLPEDQQGLYILADHVALDDASLYEMAREFQQLGGTCLCIDEIHKARDWARQLKSILDTFPDLRVIASGSSALGLFAGSLDLSRRAIFRRMEILSFREFIALTSNVHLSAVSLSDIIERHVELSEELVRTLPGQRILPRFRDYLLRGSSPHFLEFKDSRDFLTTLEQNARTTIESDLPAIKPNLTGTSVRRLRRLLSVVAASVPFTPNLKHLSSLLSIADERTLKGYLELLEVGGLIRMMERAGHGLRPMEKPEKIYLHSPGLCHALAPSRSPERGNLRETFLAAMLAADHSITAPKRGDFLVNGELTLEVGGRNKTGGQLQGIRDSFLALDDIEVGGRRRIPLWLFGLLY